MKVTPYLTFSGNCEQAVNFYKSVFGGKIDILRFNSIPAEEGMSFREEWNEKVLHCTFTFDSGNIFYASDGWEEYPIKVGDNITMHLDVASEAEVYRIIEALSVGGKITMKAEKVFWNAIYGSVTDKFNVNWGVQYELG